jgi:hypothetical protein
MTSKYEWYIMQCCGSVHASYPTGATPNCEEVIIILGRWLVCTSCNSCMQSALKDDKDYSA